MGQGMWFHALQKETLDRFIEKPEDFHDFTESDEKPEGRRATLGLDHEWHALMTLITEINLPLANHKRIDQPDRFFVGSEIPELPVNSCSAMLTAHVHETALKLQVMQAVDIETRWKSEEFRRAVADDTIYRGTSLIDDEGLTTILKSFQEMKAFFHGAAKRFDCVIYYYV